MKTAKIGIVPATFLTFLDALDKEGLGYSMARRGDGVWELDIDGSGDTTEVTLNPDGTWSATTHILVCNGD